MSLWGFKQKRITVLQKQAVRIIAFRPYISHSTAAFKELQILMLKDLYYIQLYKIYYKNVNNLLPAYFQTFTPNYNDGIDHNHDLRYNALRLPMTRKELCTMYKTGLGSSTVDQVLKYTKYPKYIPSTSTGQVLIFLKST